MATKKVYSTGRFKARYGVGIKTRLVKVEREQKKKHECPECSSFKVQRKSAGIFHCNKCNLTFAGGAYFPETMVGRVIKKIVNQSTSLSAKKENQELLKKELEALTINAGDIK